MIRLLFVFLIALCNIKASITSSSCRVAFEPVGCFRDDGRKPKPLPEQLLNDREKIDWNNWDSFMEDLVCRCAKKTLDEGYDTFGIQYYGECWSGPENLIDIDRDGSSNECISHGYQSCKAQNTTCVGKNGANFVYKLVQPSCSIQIERVGCFKDDMIPPRPLPEYILSERDPTAPSYNGTDIDWINWNSYMPGFICRCAMLARKYGYTVFSIQFFAECWSGPAAIRTYDRNGESSRCISKNLRPCKPDDRYCVGKQFTNFVYRIVEPCDITYTQLGCYRDKLDTPRPIPILMSTEQDRTSKQFNGHVVDYRRWDEHMEGMICRCAKRSFGSKFKIFGMQSYGECWSGEGERTYRKDGGSNRCVAKRFSTCPPKSLHCVGEVAANYVYYVTSCDVKFEAVGCFHDDLILPRPLPDLILSERDSTSPVFNGRRIDWLNWDTYVPEFICRCAKQAKEFQREVFGLQFYGECWSGVNGNNTFNRNGPSTKCIGPGYQPCTPGSKTCIGMTSTNYVYRIVP
ncbi:uncharacterized protein LOC116303679 [Actinia tenebrosa]|uniref:Uncharacterized protein LOC116303679 n=1 Tax=Actinia tenebrosa TaxID=6105 RepID=A0A6P8IRX0_ACTTE|nr:uncharacterized protein LOC116303679 [Actinia tenebrosa]